MTAAERRRQKVAREDNDERIDSLTRELAEAREAKLREALAGRSYVMHNEKTENVILNVREQLGLVVGLRALLVQFDDEIGIVREALDMQVNIAALLGDGTLMQPTRNAAAAAARALATLDDVRARLDEYRAMMQREGRET